MRVYTGDGIGCIKVTDIKAKTVDVVHKPLVPSRKMAITTLQVLKDGDCSVGESRSSPPTPAALVVGRSCGLVEYFDLEFSKHQFRCPCPGGSVVFCSLIESQVLAVVTKGGWLIIIDLNKVKSLGSGDLKLPSSTDDDDDDPISSWAEEYLVQYSDWSEKNRRPDWVIDALRTTCDTLKQESDQEDEEEEEKGSSPPPLPSLEIDNRITSAFSFKDLHGRACVGVAGYNTCLSIYHFDGSELKVIYKTSHTGRIFSRDRKPKIMACGYLGCVAEKDAAYTVDQRGKCRFYILQEDSLSAKSDSRFIGPIITFQLTHYNTCPNHIKLMSDDYHLNELKLGEEEGAEEDGEGERGGDESSFGEGESTAAEGAGGGELGASSAVKMEPNSDSEESTATTTTTTRVNDDDRHHHYPLDKEDMKMIAVEDHLLSSVETHCWLFGVGDAKGGAFIVKVIWSPNSDLYDQKVAAYEKTGYLEEYYDRTKIRRKLKVNVIYQIGQLIDSSSLDRADRLRHCKFSSALDISIPGTFRGIPGAVNSIEWCPASSDEGGEEGGEEKAPRITSEMICLAGLDRRLYVYVKNALGKWQQAYKINLKNKINAAAIITN